MQSESSSDIWDDNLTYCFKGLNFYGGELAGFLRKKVVLDWNFFNLCG